MPLRKMIFILAAAGLACVFLLSYLFYSKSLAAPALPNPNGYDDFQAAIRLLQPLDLASEISELNASVQENAPALELARAGLRKESQVRMKFNPDWYEQHHRDLLSRMFLGHAFIAEARIAEFEGRFSDAAGSYFDALVYGSKISRGGFLQDDQMAHSFQVNTLMKFWNLVPKLDSEPCRRMARNLLDFEMEPEPAHVLQRRERDWTMKTSGFPKWAYSRANEIIRNHSFSSAAAAESNRDLKYYVLRDQLSRLAVELATRAYQLDHGAPPATIDLLVPDYLAQIPTEQSTGKPLKLPPVEPGLGNPRL